MTLKSVEPFLPGRLVVISHKYHVRLPDGRLAVSGGFSKFKTVFAQHVKQLDLCVPVGEGQDMSGAVNYPANVSLCPLPPYSGRRGFLRHLPRMLRTLWREIGRADLVYAMCPNDMGLLGLILARIRHKPVFVSVDTDRAERARISGGWRGRAKAWLIKHTVYALLLRLGGSLPTFVTGDDFLGSRSHWRQWVKTTVTSSEIPPYRDAIPALTPPLQMIFVGRLSPEKNIACLIEAAARLCQEGEAVAVKIVGQGSHRAALEELQAERGAEECVTFMGPVPNSELRESRFLGADVLVLPSREERQGKVLLEAMACSVPVVAANAGGIPSIVSHGDNGLLFDPDSPAALARCLRQVAEDPALRARLVANGYRLATANALDHGVAAIMEEVTSFYGLPRSLGP